MNENILLSGKTSFEIEVPHTLIDIGAAKEKPLIVYLHGFNQNIEMLRKQVHQLLSIEGYHFFIQAPYPIYDRRGGKNVKDWGRAWYLYDGGQNQFIQSLESASEFVERTINHILKRILAARLAILGYSMGGYLAGYFALSRWKRVNELIVIGGRIKTEVFQDYQASYDHLNVLALHGKQDESVKSDPQKSSCEELSKWGANVTFNKLKAAHGLSSIYLKQAKNWLIKQGYNHL